MTNEACATVKNVKQLIIATNNAGKVEEFRELLDGCGWQIVSPADFGITLDVDETGTTYEENARLKAEAYARATDLAALADDSGLEVDALDGQPGALHHLNGWDGESQDERIEILLKALDDVAPEKRQARFRSVIVLAHDGRVDQTDGTCEGVIIGRAFGHGGFGYDPVFFIPERGSTMAQLTTAEKNEVSHRGIAARKMRSLLQSLADEE
jgi:XTP/dITP diphosphohydrolase